MPEVHIVTDATTDKEATELHYYLNATTRKEVTEAWIYTSATERKQVWPVGFQSSMRLVAGAGGQTNRNIGYSSGYGMLTPNVFTFNDVEYEITILVDRSRQTTDDFLLGIRRSDSAAFDQNTLNPLTLDTGSSGKMYDLRTAGTRFSSGTTRFWDIDDDVENLYTAGQTYTIRLFET